MGDEDDPIEREQRGHLVGGGQVSVVDGIERPAHHPDASPHTFGA